MPVTEEKEDAVKSEVPQYQQPAPVHVSSVQTRVVVEEPSTPQISEEERRAEEEEIERKNEEIKAKKKEIVREQLRSLVSSPLFLIGVISFCIATVLTFTSYIIEGSPITELIYELKTMISIPELDNEIIDIMGIGGAFFLIIPNIVVITGMWLTFGALKSSGTKRISTAGLVMIKVIANIQKVLMIVLSVLIGAGLLIAMIALIQDCTQIVYPMLVTVPTVAALMIVLIIYQSKVISTISAIQLAVTHEEAYGEDISIFVSVINFIVGALIAVLVLFSAVSGSLFVGIWNLSFAVTYIAFGVFLIVYKKKMKITRQKIRELDKQIVGKKSTWYTV